MLTVNKFKQQLVNFNSPYHLHVAVDAKDEDLFYIVGNGGMGTTISVLIDKFGPEITQAVMDMIAAGQLVKAEKTRMLLDQNAIVYYFTILDKVND